MAHHGDKVEADPLREAMKRAETTVARPAAPIGLQAVSGALRPPVVPGLNSLSLSPEPQRAPTLNSVADELDRLYDRMDGLRDRAYLVARALDAGRADVPSCVGGLASEGRPDGIVGRLNERVETLHWLLSRVDEIVGLTASAI